MKAQCAVPGCENPRKANGYCSAHNHRFRRYGDPLGQPAKPTLLEVVLSRIEIRGPDECWPWIGTIAHGYGRINVGPGSPRNAHCVVFELFVGEIPEGFQVDHTCHNVDPTCCGGDNCVHRRCANPLHLEAVTQAENQRRQGSRQRLANGALCRRGHLWSENTMLDKNGKRRCRTCSNEGIARWKRENRRKKAA